MRNEKLGRRASAPSDRIALALTFCERSEQSEKRERERRPQGRRAVKSEEVRVKK